MIKKITTLGAIAALVIICASSFALMIHASHTDSAIDDELAHIPAGYGYVHNLDYRLNPEHPPLIKALAMFPVLFLHPAYPTHTAAWQTEVNGQWDMGYQFLYNSGNDADAIIQTARVMPILVTILVVILIYFTARRLMGNLWALLPAFLFAFDPTVLAQGHYVTTDVGAAFGILLGLFFFITYLETPSTKHLWYAGVAFGIAQVAKFSTPLLVPLFIFITIVLWLRDLILHWSTTDSSRRTKTFLMQLCRSAGKLALIFIIGYAVIVYPLYYLFTSGYPIDRQISDTQTILGSFAGGPTLAGHMCTPLRCLAGADIWMTHHWMTRPIAQYMLGILMVLQRADGGNTISFLGQVRGSGGWLYFPILFLIKEPIPTLIVVLLALALTTWWTIKKTLQRNSTIRARVVNYLTLNIAEFSMASFIVLYWGYSIHSTLNIGLRHLMPTIPLIFILASGVWKRWIAEFATRINTTTFESIGDSFQTFIKSLFSSFIKYIFLIFLLLWLLIETLTAAPYFLSYFNEFGGGVMGGYHFVTDSNYDWGQDLLRLQAWTNANPQVDRIAVDYFGGGNPKYYLGNKEINWSSSKGNPADQGIHWLAVSVNTLEGAVEPLASGQTRNASDTYSWLTALRPPSEAPGTFWGNDMGNVPKPDYRIGTSIFVYHL